MTEHDAAEVAELHSAVFAGELSAKMGIRYIDALMRWFTLQSDAVSFIAYDGRVIAYVFGAPAGYGRIMNRDLRWIIMTSVLTHPPVMVHPSFRHQLPSRVRLLAGGRPPAREYVHSTPAVFRLVGIGVDQVWRGRGVARELLSRFSSQVFERGYERIELNVREKNVTARRLYERSGWYEVGATNGVCRYELRPSQ